MVPDYPVKPVCATPSGVINTYVRLGTSIYGAVGVLQATTTKLATSGTVGPTTTALALIATTTASGESDLEMPSAYMVGTNNAPTAHGRSECALARALILWVPWVPCIARYVAF